VTAPVHGFSDAHDYYSQSSSIGFLDRIRRPTLLLSAEDDPFLPVSVLRDARQAASQNPYVTFEVHASGGHVGFVGGQVPWRPRYYAEWRACEFLAATL
jgi:predicted alpha/beta-fold hydrolase